MDTRILASLMVIGLVASAMGMGTYAYFSDTETSTGNTFTAGEIDLELDKDGTIYNGQNMVVFDESDVKPGDQFEKTISIHVKNNDAWLCLYLDTSEAENGCNEPEAQVDTTCGDNENAELDENMEVLIWWDDGATDGYQCGSSAPCTEDEYEGDNVYQPEYEVIFYDGPASELSDQSKWTETGPWHLTGSTIYYMGIKACVGDLDPATFTCDGTSVGNDVQSDSLTIDATFYAEQYRNNPNFVCPTG